MRLRVFKARNATLALAEAREELGEDAVVLATRRTAHGVEITAAVEAAEPEFILPDPAPVPPSAELLRHNMPTELAQRLSATPLERGLGERLSFAPLPDERPIMLVGPPGAGKTLACAKLAARAAMAQREPIVVTADGARAGAVEQLAAFTRLLNLPLAVAAQPEVLRKALARRRPGQPALIDGFGCNPFDLAQAKRLLELIRAADADPVLVLPAGLDAEESAEIARAFHLLGARHLLPTRLDMARRLGGVLAAAAAGLALTEAGTGPQVAHGMTTLTPAWLAERLLQREPTA
ncbi:GTP-binding protein [Roseococcus sp. YIM B11640]|uniref:flagellar biosynthesis protein FlhF n=1 Tax=Roseococcus sp. YIM B11640 TaxID=3133973 RepID=UPI003C7BEF2D